MKSDFANFPQKEFIEWFETGKSLIHYETSVGLNVKLENLNDVLDHINLQNCIKCLNALKQKE